MYLIHQASVYFIFVSVQLGLRFIVRLEHDAHRHVVDAHKAAHNDAQIASEIHY